MRVVSLGLKAFALCVFCYFLVLYSLLSTSVMEKLECGLAAKDCARMRMRSPVAAAALPARREQNISTPVIHGQHPVLEPRNLNTVLLSPHSTVFSPPENISIVPEWQRKLRLNKTLTVNGTHYLSEALQVRIYSDDKAKWTLTELKQWMHYLFWAGVTHIFLCDHYKYDSERLETNLTR